MTKKEATNAFMYWLTLYFHHYHDAVRRGIINRHLDHLLQLEQALEGNFDATPITRAA